MFVLTRVYSNKILLTRIKFETELNRVKEKVQKFFQRYLRVCREGKIDGWIDEIDKNLVVYHSYRYEGENLRKINEILCGYVHYAEKAIGSLDEYEIVPTISATN